MNENCGIPDFFTEYQIRHLGNPFGLPDILLKIDPWEVNVYAHAMLGHLGLPRRLPMAMLGVGQASEAATSIN